MVQIKIRKYKFSHEILGTIKYYVWNDRFDNRLEEREAWDTFHTV